MTDERSQLKKRIVEGETRLAKQRDLVGVLARDGSDTSAAIILLGAIESGQAIRLRRLAALA